MKMACSNCDLGLKRSDCSEGDYIECECIRWLTAELKNTTITGFVNNVLDYALDDVCKDSKEKREAQINMIATLSRMVINYAY